MATTIITVLVIVSGISVGLLLYLPQMQKKKQMKEELQVELKQREEARRQRKLEWNEKVRRAKHHLSGAKDWRDPHGKAEFVRELFEDKVPDYLWYEFDGLTAEETGEVYSIFWPNGHPSFGDLEGHRNLRIRNAKVFMPEVQLSTGKVLPLDQVGYAHFWEEVDEGEFPEGVILFSLKGFYEN